jgi:flagellar biosynthesis protein FlhG
VTFAGADARCGRSPLLLNSARALAAAGERVLVIDERRGRGSVMHQLGLNPPGDMWDSLTGRKALEQLILPAGERLWAVSAMELAARLQQDTDVVRGNLGRMLDALRGGADFILIDGLLATSGGLSVFSAACVDHIVVVVGVSGNGITEAYALIKRLAQDCAREHFQVVLTQSKNEAAARKVFANLERTARTHLGVALEWLALVPTPVSGDIGEELYGCLPLPPRRAAGASFQP